MNWISVMKFDDVCCRSGGRNETIQSWQSTFLEGRRDLCLFFFLRYQWSGQRIKGNLKDLRHLVAISIRTVTHWHTYKQLSNTIPNTFRVILQTRYNYILRALSVVRRRFLKPRSSHTSEVSQRRRVKRTQPVKRRDKSWINFCLESRD